MGIGDKLKPYPVLHKTANKMNHLRNEYVTFLPFKIWYLMSHFKNNSKKRILFYPEKPIYYHTLYQVCKINDFAITNKPQKADVVVHFEDTTHRKHDKVIREIAKKQNVINYHCWDISKKRVEKVHKKIFGYNLSIDPQSYREKYIRKGNTNTSHDGIILSRLTKPQKGYVYQRLINNVSNREAVDIRIPVFGKIIPFAYLKYRPVAQRFSDKYTRAYIVKPSSVITKKEYDSILKMCDEMGLDSGELDVLRDNDTARLYVVDVNNTPAGPPLSLSVKEKIRAIQLMSDAFQQSFLNS